MKRVLIISSEPLTPQYTVGSTFELSQAKILSSLYEVAILAVTDGGSLSNSVKSGMKKLLNRGKGQNRPSLKEFYRLFKSLFSGAVVNRYMIEGIPVYEGVQYSWMSRGSFGRNLDRWIGAGMGAFKAYAKTSVLPHLIHAHGRFLNAGALAFAIKGRWHIPYIYTEHSTFYQRGLAPPASKQILAKVLEGASRVIAVSSSLLNHVEEFLQRKLPNALVVPNVIDEIFETTLVKRQPSKGQFQLVTIAALEHKKGIDILLHSVRHAFPDNQDFTLTIVGEGPLFNELTALSQRLGIFSSVNFAGRKDKTEVKELLDHSDALILPSRSETFGVVIVEALSRGCPVIATISGGPEFLINEHNGILVRPENPIELSAAILNMRARRCDYNRDSIQADVLTAYGTRSFQRRMNDIYSVIIDNRRVPQTA
jgi:glycosyltransferase involved in cell wall biosynthesis